jgi:hypothetical protein
MTCTTKRLDVSSPFRVLQPDGSLAENFTIDQGDLPANLKKQILLDARSLLDCARHFFCGLYPLDTPHNAWGDLMPLPWHFAYKRAHWTGALDHHQAINMVADIELLAAPLLSMCWAEDEIPEYGGTYFVVDTDDSQEMIKSLALEVMLAVDIFLLCLRDNNCKSVMWISLAFKNISECATQANIALSNGNRGRRKGSVSGKSKVAVH